MTKAEKFNKVSDEMDEALDTTIDLLLERGVREGLQCIKKASKEEIESAGNSRLSIRDKVDMVVLLTTELNSKEIDSSWLVAALDHYDEISHDVFFKLAQALAYYNVEMGKSLNAFISDNPERFDGLDGKDDPKYNKLMEEALAGFDKMYTILRFTISRLCQMNDRLLD